MANHKSAVKQHRRSLANRGRNRQHMTRMKSRVKGLRKAMQDGDLETARGMLAETLSIVDKSEKVGVIHRRCASRTKSRLTRAVNKLAANS